jgi:predicted peptidase
MYHPSLALLLIMILLAGTALCTLGAEKPCADTQSNDIPRGFIAKTMTIGAREIKYVVYVPASYDPEKPMPTIIFLNGMGECGRDGWRQCFHFGNAIMLDAEKWPFIVVFPQKQSKESFWEDEEIVMMTAFEKTKKEYNIDLTRLYLTGLSQGGHGTWAIAAKHPEMFAAIAPVCGWGDEKIASKLTKMPIWTFHGDADQAVDVERSKDMKKWVEAAGGEVKLTVYPGVGHNSWDNAFRNENLGDWFLQFRSAAK